MRLPSLTNQKLEAFYNWAQRVIARYEQDFTILAGASTLGIAAAGTTAADAQQLSTTMNEVKTTAAGAGVRLPDPTGLVQTIWVANMGAHVLLVYPPALGQINALGVNTGFSLGTGKVATFAFASNLQAYGGALA